MFYDEELYEVEETVFNSLPTAHDLEDSSSSVIVINGDSPSLQNKIARELQNLLSKPFIHINIYQKLMLESGNQQLSSDDLSLAIQKIHAHIVSLARNGNNIIVSHNAIFAAEQKSLYKSLKRYAPYWVDLHDQKRRNLSPDLQFNVGNLSVTQATFMIYNSLVMHREYHQH